MKNINVITLCSGYDSQCMALERIKKDFGLDYNLVAWSEIDKLQAAGISKTQQYKMAGNSIVVDVLYHIFRKMFIEKKNSEPIQLSLF